MKPDWKDAPEWARYLAMDKNGSWLWYENEPTPNSTLWESHGQYARAIAPKIDWLQSLEPRP
jgi:hypothetical protein